MRMALLNIHMAESKSITKLLSTAKNHIPSQRPLLVAEAQRRAEKLARDLGALL